MKKYIVFLLLSNICFLSLEAQTVKHFVFPNEMEAVILKKGGGKSSMKLNYNKATEEMVYSDTDGQKKALYPISQIDTIYFSSRKFIPSGKGFEEVLLTGKYPLYASYRCRLSAGTQNIGYGSSSTTAVDNISSLNTGGEIYQLKLPENYKAEPYTVYAIAINGQNKHFRRIKEITKIFPELKKEISDFPKKNKLKNNNDGIISIIRYISSL